MACTNFHALCEPISQRHFIGKPFFVLSNDDCFVIFRSYEVKELGIAKDSPEFKIR